MSEGKELIVTVTSPAAELLIKNDLHEVKFVTYLK
jgi:hypothetical protein